MTDNPDPNELPSHPGPKSVFEKYLDKNPEQKAKYLTARRKADSPIEHDFSGSDIANVDGLIEYFIYELTRSAKEDVLRGKTLVDYSTVFQKLFEFKVTVDEKIAIADAKCKKIIDDTTEVDTFMKIIYEAITQTITDIQIRKELSEKIKTLYDKHYPTAKSDTTTKSDGASSV